MQCISLMVGPLFVSPDVPRPPPLLPSAAYSAATGGVLPGSGQGLLCPVAILIRLPGVFLGSTMKEDICLLF